MTQSQAEPFQISAWVPCPSCPRGDSFPLAITPEHFRRYLQGRPLSCPNCKNLVDWWKAVLLAVNGRWGVVGVYQAIECKQTAFQVELKRSATVEVDFSRHGVPQSAIVLSVSYTASGRAIPIEVHGNTPVREPINLKQFLYGMPLPADLLVEVTDEAYIFVTWIDPGENEVSIHHLVDAARSFDAKRFNGVIIPANIAVESALTPALSDAIAAFCGKEQLEQFFANAATYSYQLSVIAPMIAHMVEAPRLPDHVLGALHKLRKLRNSIGHSGRSGNGVTLDHASEGLAAAIFGYHYAKLLHEHVRTAKEAKSLPDRR